MVESHALVFKTLWCGRTPCDTDTCSVRTQLHSQYLSVVVSHWMTVFVRTSLDIPPVVRWYLRLHGYVTMGQLKRSVMCSSATPRFGRLPRDQWIYNHWRCVCLSASDLLLGWGPTANFQIRFLMLIIFQAVTPPSPGKSLSQVTEVYCRQKLGRLWSRATSEKQRSSMPRTH